MHATESTDDVFTYRPRKLTVAWRPASQEHADAWQDSLEWRYGPRCAVEAHWGREMS